MTDDCRSIREQARALEQEVALTRAVVAALRSSSPSARARRPPASPPKKLLVAALLTGFLLGAATVIALTGPH
jgi:hypothetical protein